MRPVFQEGSQEEIDGPGDGGERTEQWVVSIKAALTWEGLVFTHRLAVLLKEEGAASCSPEPGSLTWRTFSNPTSPLAASL